MTQDMKIDMILHTITKRLIRNGRTRVRLGAHCSSLRDALIQKQYLCADEITARASRHYVSCLTRLRLVVILLLMMTVGVNTAWGQVGKDYSGTYYIANNNKGGYSNNDITQNYYLCPSIYVYDTNQPLLTTYKERTLSEPNPENSRWRVVFAKTEGGVNYYHLIHSSNKYLTWNEALSTANPVNNDRVRVHLQSTLLDINTSDDQLFFFVVGNNVANSYNICPKAWADRAKGASLNPAKYNNDSYEGSTANLGNGGPGSFKNKLNQTKGCGGLIGVYDNNDATGIWFLEDYITRPTIVYNASNLIEITPAQTGTVTIKYTTDGSTPSATNGEIYSTPFDPADNVTTIKAIAIVNGEESNVTTFKPIVLLGSSHKRLIQNQGDPWNETDFHFYMIPGDEVEGITKVNTTSLFRPSMEWYFSNAGVESDIQYYYIVNNVNGKSLCYDETNIVYMANNDNSNKFKFSIAEPTTAGTYNIIPYGVTKKFIQKDSGNGSVNPVYLKSESYNTSNNQYARWKFILPTELDRNAPFTASDPTNLDYHYFTITTSTTNNNVTTTYYLAPGTANVQTLTSSDASALWYFEVVQPADATDWLTYYHIRNAVTGDYLYFDIESYNANTTSSCFKTSTTIEGNAERYKFTWAKTASASVNYYIVPKLMKDASQNTISTLYRNNNTNIRLDQTRSTGTRVWNFESTTYNCAQPEITWSDSDNGYIITASESDANIYYTIGDGELTPSTGTPYTVAISVAELSGTTATIRAIAARSSGGSDASTVASVTVSKVETPTFTLSDGKVQISCTTTGASIYYEIGNTADGVSTPTSSSTPYSVPIENAEGKYIKAIAVKGGLINSAVAASSQILFPCATPVIRKATATTFTISCSYPTSGVTIYYTKGANPADPTTSSTQYIGAVSFTASELPFTVKAIAVASNYENSGIATLEITESLTLDDDDCYIIASDDDFKKFITMANGADSDKKYKITDDIDATGTSAVSTAFTGELMGVAKADGTFPVISNLGHPIFNTINGGTVKNIMLNKVSISQAGNVGAIAGVASGYTRIYNCGILPTDATNSSPSTVASTDDNCGGLVGWLKEDSRVVNCFSYANITGGTDVAGIVGHNEIASTAEEIDGKYANLRTAVVNCMFYGNITGGSNRYPVYGGEKIVNNTATGINNYDFYRAEASLGLADDNHYNCSWPAPEDYLTKYEFYRNLLNSNRELCGWWVKSDVAPNTLTTSLVQNIAKDASLMAKWVLDPSVAPYPILKKFGKYASPVNIDADASWRETANEWEGKKLGTLKVTINPGAHAAGGASTKSNVDFTITDMDTLRADYCYRKIQLPYYNTVFGDPNGGTWATKYGGNYGDYVVIGWKVSTTEGTAGTLTENWETGYNFADRNCTAKDANRVFAQGGYYYVPEGVENITITAQWASATYIDNTDHSYDRVYMSGSKPGTHFAPAGYRPSTLGNGKTVSTSNFTNIASAQGVFNQAVVLVGNHQYRHSDGSNGDHIGSGSGFTVMSADFDCDDEPDYCLIWQLGQKYQRRNFSPIRFDFLPVEEMGLAMKEDGSTRFYSLGCYRPLGHFEVTETSLIHFGQFEFSNLSRTIYAPLILNGGIFDQYTKGTNNNAFKTADDKIDYIIIGGNVRMPSFTPGAHVNDASNFPTRHCAVNVIGGNIDYLYLTGNYHDNVTPNADNPHCYIDGGRIKQVAAAGKEGIDGDVYFEIYHSKIWEFYGGSTMDKSDGTNFKIVKGNINVNIDNSIVDKYCGGPKFGDMIYDEDNPENSKTITTNANNTIFGVYYGGGNGGTSYVQYDKTDVTTSLGTGYNWNGTGNNQGHIGNYTAGNYRSGDHNYMADYDMEIVNVSTGTESGQAVFRTYFYAAQFSATNTGPIINNLTDCTVLTNFYGGGNLGGVKGSVTSTLAGTTHVLGSVFGAGYSATIPDVIIHAKDKTAPNININTGIISPQSGGTGDTYTWCGYKNPSTKDEVVPSGVVIPSDVGTGSPSFQYGGKDYYYTEVPLINLGAVSGAVTLTITGNTIIEGKVFNENGTVDNTKIGGVYGGGDASAVKNDTNPANASTKVNLSGNTEILGNVFGGGNKGTVSGSTEVNIEE